MASEVQRINHKDFKDPEVDLCISIRALTTVDKATKVRERERGGGDVVDHVVSSYA